ncbi:MAG: heavy-metal-associated domain-containing protein [Chloroflexota bacterium]|nr:heavy-metal-associated domain-containing protein [Chloroflexota bacterium]
MKQVTLTVPTMYADHHVTRVKNLLSPLAGIENVAASSAFKEVVVEFDEKKTTQDALVKALADAGYAPGQEQVVERSPFATPDVAWEKLGVRVTETSQVDLQLSGEFRKY